MGTLYLVATPIGNLEDISARAVRVLRECVLIAAEDTRHSDVLLKHFDVDTPTTSYFEHNKLKKLDSILDALAHGDVALISDAGMPAVNDPGFELVRVALGAGFDVRPVPGPSAPISALAVSGLPTDSFLYLGYLPHKSSDRRKFIAQVTDLRYTLIFLESPHRVIEALEDLFAVLGDRPVCVAREMTKKFEEFWRGGLSAACEHFRSQPARGEYTLVIEGQTAKQKEKWPQEKLLKAIHREMKKERTARELAAELSDQSGWNKREVYKQISQSKQPES